MKKQNKNQDTSINKIIDEEGKEPYKVLCGVCYCYMGKSDNPEGELGYDRCEDSEDYYMNR